jgi:hypothetical protein
MRAKAPSSAWISKTIAQRVEREYSTIFQENADLAELRTRQFLEASTLTRLFRESVYRAVDAFNQNAPWELQLAILDKGDRLVFNSDGRFTLSLTYRDHRVLCQAGGGSGGWLEPLVLEVYAGKVGLEFRQVGAMAETQPAILDEVQFMCSVIRMALDRQERSMC